MFDIGFWEFLLAIAVALVVIKPEDLPDVMRKIGKMVRKINALSREFYACLEDITDEAYEPINEAILEEKNLINEIDNNVYNDKNPMQG